MSQAKDKKAMKSRFVESSLKAINKGKLVFSESHAFASNHSKAEDDEVVKAFCQDICNKLR